MSILKFHKYMIDPFGKISPILWILNKRIPDGFTLVDTMEEAKQVALSALTFKLHSAASKYVELRFDGQARDAWFRRKIYNEPLNEPRVSSCSQWMDLVWADYYTRKYMLANGMAISYDFSNHGEPRWNFLETITPE